MLKDALLRGRGEAFLLFRVKDASLGEAVLHLGKSVGLGALSTGVPAGLAAGVMGRAKNWKERAENAGRGFFVGAIPGAFLGTAFSLDDALRMMRPPMSPTTLNDVRRVNTEARVSRNEIRRQNDPNPLPIPQLDVARGQTRTPSVVSEERVIRPEPEGPSRFSLLEIDPPLKK